MEPRYQHFSTGISQRRSFDLVPYLDSLDSVGSYFGCRSRSAQEGSVFVSDDGRNR